MRTLIALVCLAAGLRGQQFEVASIRSSAPSPDMVQSVMTEGGRMVARNVTLQTLVRVGYRVSTLQIAGLPGWARDERFDVVAKVEEGSMARTLREMAPMVRSLLAERFGIRTHAENRNLTVRALGPAKTGLRVRPSNEGDGALRMTKRSLDGKRVAMEDIARALSDVTGSLVVDETGFTSFLDVHLAWLPDGEEPREDSPPSFSASLEDALGLVIRTKRTPVAVVVVDSAERPGAN